jgi:hypothetical protein
MARARPHTFAHLSYAPEAGRFAVRPSLAPILAEEIRLRYDRNRLSFSMESTMTQRHVMGRNLAG